jgi:hypothetical protein
MLHLALFRNQLVPVGPCSVWTWFDYPAWDESVGDASGSHSLILADE